MLVCRRLRQDSPFSRLGRCHSGTALSFGTGLTNATVSGVPAFTWGESTTAYTIAYWINVSAPNGMFRSVLHKGRRRRGAQPGALLVPRDDGGSRATIR